MTTKTHEIKLDGYGAHTTLAEDRPIMLLGTAESYGIEMLHVVSGSSWEGLTITATFNAPDGTSTDMLMNADGSITVPSEATAKSGSGKIVFTGVSDGVQRISCDLEYFVVAHSAINGVQSGGTAPSWFEQAATRFMPPGGTAGQVLTKLTNTDFDAGWQDSQGGAGLAPLVGTTQTITPSQVLAAMKAGRDIALQHTDSHYGAFVFSAFNASEQLGRVVSNSIIPHLDGLTGTLLGGVEDDLWFFDATNTATKDDVGTAVNEALTAAKASGEFDGKSAYQYAQDGGYTGTEEEFAAKLAAAIPTVDSTLAKSGQAADAAVVGNRLSSLSEKIVDISTLTLGVHTDGLVYIFFNGLPIGSGIKIDGNVVELSDGITLTTLMFSDDFEGDRLGSTWKPAYGHDNPALSNWWSAGEENLGVADSCLRLTMLRNNPNSSYEISSAKVETMQHEMADNYGFDTGYCEVKFKLDKVGSGIWPAIWCVGQTQTDAYSNITADSVTRTIHGRSWPWAGEIDQLDAMGCGFTPGLIYQTNPYDSTILTMKGSEHKSLEANTWYLLGLYKSKDKIKVYLNRILIGTFDIADNECFSSMGEKLIINLSTGSLAGTLPEDINEVNMYVDYVKIYSLTDGYTTLAEQNVASLLPDYAEGFACVAGRNFLLYPQFAENTQNTALYWASSNPAVAKVENGYIKTIENGECVISATDASGSQIINFALTVKDDAGIIATSMVVTSSVSAIAADGSSVITADIYPTNCDVLTPTLEIMSGGDYCTVDGLTINNINSSGQDQEAVIRVKTNNPSVYQDITIIIRTAVSYDVSPDNNLLCNYNVRTMTGGTSDSFAFRWDDAKGNGNQLYFPNTGGSLVFAGLGATSSNAIWYNNVGQNVISDNLPDAFTALVLVSLESGSLTAFTNGDTMNQYSAPSEKIVQLSTQLSFYKDTVHAAKVTMDNILSQKIVLGETFGSNAEVSAVCVTADGTLYKTNPVSSLYKSTGEMGNLRAFGGNVTNGGFIGSFYQILVFNKVLSDEEIISFATQMFEKN